MAARSNMSVEDRITIAVQMLAEGRKYGEATALAGRYGISRQMAYYLEDKGERVLRKGLMATCGPIWEDGYVRVTSERLKRSVTLLELVGVSQQDTVLALEENAGHASIASVSSASSARSRGTGHSAK